MTADNKINNNVDKYIRIKQAEMIKEKGDNVTLTEVYKAISEATGIPETSVSLIKSRNYTPSLSVALKLAKYFGVDVTDLFNMGNETHSE